MHPQTKYMSLQRQLCLRLLHWVSCTWYWLLALYTSQLRVCKLPMNSLTATYAQHSFHAAQCLAHDTFRAGERGRGSCLASISPVHISRQGVCSYDNDVPVLPSADELSRSDESHYKAAACCCQIKCHGLLGPNQCLHLHDPTASLPLHCSSTRCSSPQALLSRHIPCHCGICLKRASVLLGLATAMLVGGIDSTKASSASLFCLFRVLLGRSCIRFGEKT